MHRAATRKHSHQSNISHELARIKNAFTRATHRARGKANRALIGALDNVKEKSDLLQENVTDYVATKPFKSMGLAMLTGAIIGYFIHK